MKTLRAVFLVLCFLPCLANAQASQDPSAKTAAITVDAHFENGYIGSYVFTSPDTLELSARSGDLASWYSFRLKGVKGKKINFVIEWKNKGKIFIPNYNGRINDKTMVTYDGKGYEIIKDQEFVPMQPETISDQYFSGKFRQKFSHLFRENEALVSYAAPFPNSRVDQLAEQLKGDPRVTMESIGNSRFKHLPIRYFKLTDSSVPDAGKKRIFITGREDSYEVGGSWATEGIMRFLLSKDPVAVASLKNLVFYIFPIFSVDGVAMGSTNFPLSEDGLQYIYVTAQWNREQPYEEVRLMKAFWDKLKTSGENIDVALKCHATCYWECHFRPEDCAPDNKDNSRKLLGMLRGNLPWRAEAGPLGPGGVAYMNAEFIKVFPNAITYSSHNDFVFTKNYLKTNEPVIRRHEDVLQDGELIVRAFAEYFGIPRAAEVAPFLMAGDVNTNNGKKGDTVHFWCYYYDVNKKPAQKVLLVIGDHRYEMKAPKEPDYSKPVRFECEVTLAEKRNDYHFEATNGSKDRRIPEQYELPGPFLVE